MDYMMQTDAERPADPEKEARMAQARARRLASGMSLEDLPKTEKGLRIAALVPAELEVAIAKREAKEKREQIES